MNKISIFCGWLLFQLRRLSNRLISTYELSKIKHKGIGCYINGPGYFTSSNIELGENVYIGIDSTFMCSNSKIKIGNKSVFGPHCFIIGGNHRFDVLGKAILDVHEKREEDDSDIIIEEDCWIGAGAIILKGVKIGRGSVVGAGSIVTKEIPPYAIYTNKGLRRRFSINQIMEHESALYPSEKRFTEVELSDLSEKFNY